MKYIFLLMLLLPSCITCPVCEECEEKDPIYIDCAEQIKDEKIKTIDFLIECQAELKKYEEKE